MRENRPKLEYFAVRLEVNQQEDLQFQVSMNFALEITTMVTEYWI
jgi:hypothetical protein